VKTVEYTIIVRVALRQLQQSADGAVEASRNADGALWILKKQKQDKEEGVDGI